MALLAARGDRADRRRAGHGRMGCRFDAAGATGQAALPRRRRGGRNKRDGNSGVSAPPWNEGSLCVLPWGRRARAAGCRVRSVRYHVGQSDQTIRIAPRQRAGTSALYGGYHCRGGDCWRGSSRQWPRLGDAALHSRQHGRARPRRVSQTPGKRQRSRCRQQRRSLSVLWCRAVDRLPGLGAW